jgi:hypothetical protein
VPAIVLLGARSGGFTHRFQGARVDFLSLVDAMLLVGVRAPMG